MSRNVPETLQEPSRKQSNPKKQPRQGFLGGSTPHAPMRKPRSPEDYDCVTGPKNGDNMNRRNFLSKSGLLAATPFMAAAQQGGRRDEQPREGRGGRGGMARGPVGERGLQPLDGGKIGNTPAMKITDIKTFLVGAGGRNWVYVKILTDQGIFGIGEAYSAGPDEATIKVIEDFKIWLVGNDPRNVQYLFDLMYNTTRFPGGIMLNSRLCG